ncbi:hypothetical protein MY10362_005265 [Beauveria mimosiformis]
MAMPDPGSFWGDKLVESVKNGSNSHHLTWYEFKQDKEIRKAGFGMPKDVTKPHEIVDSRDPAAKPVLFDGAVQGHTFLDRVMLGFEMSEEETAGRLWDRSRYGRRF